MAGETGAELVNSTVKITEGTLRLFIELMKYLREKARQNSQGNRDTFSSRRLERSRGAVSNDNLNRLAQRRRTTVVPMAEKISLAQQEKIIQKCRERGIPCSIVAVNRNDREIARTERELARLDEKAGFDRRAIADIDRRRAEYCDKVVQDGGTVNDKILKDFDAQRAEHEKAIANLDFLNDEEKTRYKELQTKLHGDPINGVKGLYDERREACVNYLASDAQVMEQIVAEVNKEHRAELCQGEIERLEEKAKNGTLTTEEAQVLEELKTQTAGIENELAQDFNQRSKEEVFKEVAERAEKTHDKMSLEAAMNRNTKTHQTGEHAWIFDPQNPTNYIKVTKHWNEDEKKLEHTYDVFSNGEQQSASAMFGTNGIYTDKYAKNGNYPRYIDEDGKDTTKENGMHYWTALRNEMGDKTDLNDKDVYIFYNEKEFTEYLETFKEAEQEIKDKREKETYDLSEDVQLDGETTGLETKLMNVKELQYSLREEIDAMGYQYKYGSGGKEDSFVKRETGEKYTISDLKNDLKTNYGDIAIKGELLLKSAKNKVLVQIEKAQYAIIEEAENIRDKMKHTEHPEEVDKSKYNELVNEKDKLIGDYEALERKEAMMLASQQKDEVELDFSHGERDLGYDQRKSLAEWDKTIELVKESKKEDANITNEAVKVVEQKAHDDR